MDGTNASGAMVAYLYSRYKCALVLLGSASDTNFSLKNKCTFDRPSSLSYQITRFARVYLQQDALPIYFRFGLSAQRFGIAIL